MALDVDALLSSPRGRRLCLEFAVSGRSQETPEGTILWELLFSSTHRLEMARGQAGKLFGPGAEEPLPDPSVADVAAALENISLDAVDDLNVLRALAATVDGARYWQEPDGTDELLLAAGMGRALKRVATHLAASPSVSWWDSPADSVQWNVQFKDEDLGVPPRPPAHEALRLWKVQEVENDRTAAMERPADPEANWSGEWWSTPGWALTTSTRELPGLGPVGLWLVEDGRGWEEACSEVVDHERAPRVYEITGADSWAHLCRKYSLDVTATRRHDWYRTTGRDGRWVIPDWSQVALDFDAVHLSIAAYVFSAGRSIQVDDTGASVLAGWNPDETCWLTDVSSRPATRTSWTLGDETEQWRKV